MSSSVKQRLLREEGGFSLPELLVTMLMMLTVMFALYSIFDMSLRVFSFGNDRVEAVENARLGMARMERDVRSAYPVDKVADPPLEHLFFAPGNPAAPTAPGERTITFGNDRPQGSSPPNRRILDSLSNAAEPGEEITYRLNNGSGACPALPTAVTDGVCTLQRVENGTASPVVEYVVPDGLTFTYLRSNLQSATASDGTDIGVVRIRLEVNVDGRTQTLTTDVDLRNRGR